MPHGWRHFGTIAKGYKSSEHESWKLDRVDWCQVSDRPGERAQSACTCTILKMHLHFPEYQQQTQKFMVACKWMQEIWLQAKGLALLPHPALRDQLTMDSIQELSDGCSLMESGSGDSRVIITRVLASAFMKFGSKETASAHGRFNSEKLNSKHRNWVLSAATTYFWGLKSIISESFVLIQLRGFEKGNREA